MTRDQEKHNTAHAVIAGLTRNLPNEKDTSLHLGDGVPLSRNDGSSAMTAIALVCFSSVNVFRLTKYA